MLSSSMRSGPRSPSGTGSSKTFMPSIWHRSPSRRWSIGPASTPALIEDVIMGCVSQTGEQGLNIARNAALAAGFPEEVVGTTIDRQCGSSQQAAHFAAQGVMAGAYDVVIAAGIESMTRIPMGITAQQGPGMPFGPLMLERYSHGLVPQGLSAEMICEKWGLSRTPTRPGRARLASASRHRHRGRSLRFSDRSGHRQRRVRSRGGSQGRGDPLGDVARETGDAAAGLQDRRTRHRRQLVADLGRSCRGPDHERGQGQRTRAATAGSFRVLCSGRGRPRHHAHRADPCHQQGAGEVGFDDGPDRSGRDQRGLRGGCRCLAGRARRRRSFRALGTGPMSTGERSHSATRWVLPVPDFSPPWSTNWNAPAAVTVCRRCARAVAWPTPRSSKGYRIERMGQVRYG